MTANSGLSLAASADQFRLDETAPSQTPARWWALCIVVAAQFMFVMDAFIVNVAIPSIRVDLHASSAALEAILAVYQVAYAALVITGGRLGDILGRRRVFITGVLAFTVASVWCALSGSGAELVVARLVQGATAALMVPQVLATIHALFPGADRHKAFAVFGIALGLGGAVGFALGGWLVTLDLFGLGWRSVFLVNLPIGASIALAALRLMPGTVGRPGMRLDLRGAALLFLSLSCLIGTVMAGQELGWPWWIWGVGVAGAIILTLFPRLEREVDRRGGLPLIDLALLADRAFRKRLAAAFLFHFGNVSFYLVMTLFMQNELGFSPLQGGLAVLPLAIAFTIASRLAATWASRGQKAVLLGGSAIQLIGLVALAYIATASTQPGMLLVMPPLAVFGFGQGLVMALLAGIVLATVSPAHAGSAAGMLNTVQQTAGAVGVSIIGAVYFQAGVADHQGILAAIGLLGVSVLLTGGMFAKLGKA